MEQLPSLGKAISEVAMPTMRIYSQLLEENAEAIRSTRQKTFTYGPHPRHTLDVYYPKPDNEVTGKSSNPTPVLVFLHGGGLVVGSKELPNIGGGLAYANVGHFFAEKYGFYTVIPDYRLISHDAKFPSGGLDVALVVEWIKKRLVSELVSLQRSPAIDLFIMGNSAGGIHLSTFLFDPSFQATKRSVLPSDSTEGVHLRGVIPTSVPFNFTHADPSRADVLTAYYADRATQNCPEGLVQEARRREHSDQLLSDIQMMVLNATLDPDDEIISARDSFLKTWYDETWGPQSQRLIVKMIDGHNHISPPLSLGTNKEAEEAWGHQVGEFCNSLRRG